MSEFVSGSADTAVPVSASGLACAPRWMIAALGVVCLGLAAFFPARAAEAFSADAVKAEFLYRFAGYVEWPTDAPGAAPFVIGVASADGVLNELQHLMSGRTLQNRAVEIRKVAAVADLENVQILYVPSRKYEGAHALLAAAAGRPILVVTDEKDGLAHGSIVNFVEVDRHIRFEISLTAAERSKLKINSGLLSVAAYVEGVRPRADAACWQLFAFGFTPACSRHPALARSAHVAARFS